MRRLEDYGLRGLRDEKSAEARQRQREHVAEELNRLRAARHRATKAWRRDGAPPVRKARPKPTPSNALPLFSAGAPPGIYRTRDGGTVAVGEAYCRAQLAEIRARKSKERTDRDIDVLAEAERAARLRRRKSKTSTAAARPELEVA